MPRDITLDLSNSYYMKGKPSDIKLDYSRDALLTPFGRATLEDSYLFRDESYQEAFARVATYYANTTEMAQRLYDYISLGWLGLSTPVLSNGGTDRGLPISCYVNEAEDSLEGIARTWIENYWMGARGGGVGSYWGNLRSIGEKIKDVGITSGLMPFAKVQESITKCVNQGSLRRANAAIYLQIWHPEIEEFIEIRQTTGASEDRRTPHLHHGICITNDFMRAVEKGDTFDLKSPRSHKVIKTIDARTLWARILTLRVETGEPYLIFIDNVNAHLSPIHKALNLLVKTSQLCTEIFLPTGRDHHNAIRTAVCALSSPNAEFFDEWSKHPNFMLDVFYMMDNILQDFIDNAPEEFKNSVYSATRERSIGVGIMGFHSYLQKKGIPWESALAKSINFKIFKHLREQADLASKHIAKERGPNLDALDSGIMDERFTYKLAVAPNASSSIICQETSAGIEPKHSNGYIHKTKTGSFEVKNKWLIALLEKYQHNTDEVWTSIFVNKGSVQHLDFLTDYEKDTFKTFQELDQNWLIEFATDRTP